MPLYWTIDSQARLFTVVAEGEVSLSDATEMLEAMAGAGALAYRKLFDGRAGTSSMSTEELLMVCVKIRAQHTQGKIGPLVVIATPVQTLVFARLLGVLATADRPIKVFDSPKRARMWIEDQADT